MTDNTDDNKPMYTDPNHFPFSYGKTLHMDVS